MSCILEHQHNLEKRNMLKKLVRLTSRQLCIYRQQYCRQVPLLGYIDPNYSSSFMGYLMTMRKAFVVILAAGWQWRKLVLWNMHDDYPLQCNTHAHTLKIPSHVNLASMDIHIKLAIILVFYNPINESRSSKTASYLWLLYNVLLAFLCMLSSFFNMVTSSVP